MKTANYEKSIAIAILMGVLTMLFCLVIADGLLGINGLQVENSDGSGVFYSRVKIGAVIFWIFIIGLPLLFTRWVKWRHTIPNLLLYFLIYFPIYNGFGSSDAHALLDNVGFFAIPVWLYALFTAVSFWGIQSLVYLVYNALRYILKKVKKA